MKQQRGFTLIELIVVIVLTGILASTITIFFKPAIDSYFASQRRAALADAADTAVRRMAREIRSAVPNSILEHDTTCIEFVPTIAGGRFRMAAHVNPPAPLATEDIASDCQTTTQSCSLDLTAPSSNRKTAFDVLQLSSSKPPEQGDFIVIGNQEAAEVYGGTNRETIKKFNDPAPDITFGTHRIYLENSSFASAQGYDMGRFSVVPASGSVSFVCAGTGPLTSNGRGPGKLYRVTRTLGTTKPTSCPAITNAPVLADKVESCRFIYSANDGTQQNGLVWMEIKLTDDNERVTLAFGTHVSNVP